MRPTKVLIGAIKLSQRENSCDRDAPNEADGRSPPCYHPWPAIGSAEACGHPADLGPYRTGRPPNLPGRARRRGPGARAGARTALRRVGVWRRGVGLAFDSCFTPRSAGGDAVVWPHSPDGVPRCQPLLARAFMRGRMARRCAASGCATTYPTAFTAALSLGWSPPGLRLPSNKAVCRCRALLGICCIIPDARHCTLSSLQTAIQIFGKWQRTDLNEQ